MEQISALPNAVGCRVKSPSLEKKKNAVMELMKALGGSEKLSLKILVPESKREK